MEREVFALCIWCTTNVWINYLYWPTEDTRHEISHANWIWRKLQTIIGYFCLSYENVSCVWVALNSLQYEHQVTCKKETWKSFSFWTQQLNFIFSMSCYRFYVSKMVLQYGRILKKKIMRQWRFICRSSHNKSACVCYLSMLRLVAKYDIKRW